MTKSWFNIKKITKVSIVLIISLMLNVGYVKPSYADWWDNFVSGMATGAKQFYNVGKVVVQNTVGGAFNTICAGIAYGGKHLAKAVGADGIARDLDYTQDYFMERTGAVGIVLNWAGETASYKFGWNNTAYKFDKSGDIAKYGALNTAADMFESFGGTDAANALRNAANYYENEHQPFYVSGCPVSTYRDLYTCSNTCWVVIVFETLTGAFLTAAEKGLGVVQNAGKIILFVGFVLWLAKWGLDKVSSFNEIQLANILGELFKFSFKILFAYLFITVSTFAIRDYFVRPIMSVGSIIGQNMWHKEVKKVIEDWDRLTDEDYVASNEIVSEIMEQSPENVEPADATEGLGSDLTDEEIAENEYAIAKNNENFSKSEIPNLLIPGISEGRISSGAGCRPTPIGGGSKCHKGVDISIQGVKNTGICVPYLAAGPGELYYQTINGYGRVAIINHGKVGNYYWATLYAHMGSKTDTLKKVNNLESKMSVNQGTPIGCIGGSGGSPGAIDEEAYAVHGHFEVHATQKDSNGQFSGGKQVDPLALAGGVIEPIQPICDKCNGKNRITTEAAEKFLNCKTKVSSWTCQKELNGGFAAAGYAIEEINSSNDAGITTPVPKQTVITTYDYNRKGAIMPKSIMNSMLGALRVINNTVAENMVLGRSIMCYADMQYGGKIQVKMLNFDTGLFVINLPMWLQGAVLFVFGLMLTIAVAYYFLDITFKIGFSILLIPIAIALWPFEPTKDRLAKVLSILLKASASFAFMAIITAYGMALVEASLGTTLEEIYKAIDSDAFNQTYVKRTRGPLDAANVNISNKLALFTTNFLFLCMAMYYFFSLVGQAINTYTNHFFPDGVFGNSSPMHEGLTGATQKLGKVAAAPGKAAMNAVQTQVGEKVKGAAAKFGRGVGNFASKPVNWAMKKFGGKSGKGGGK